ncbi:hypothetical protein [Peribacillus alkalitolerans]|uniref:hypothetical protein n=1 Tax=Peribacillus alkalitolerans TaxID=1550385 RepID=UPI0013CFFAD0|nr:hypothetical protein [Peribacillus alkalitolerans]
MDVKKLFKAVGIAIIISAVFGAVSGWIGFSKLPIFSILLFFVTYSSAGVLSALWNEQTPYSAAYFSGVTLAVLNMLFTIFFMDVNVWTDADSTFRSLLLGAGACVLASFLTIQFGPTLSKLR